MFAKRLTAPNQLDLGLNLSTKKTRKRKFLDEMNCVVPWSALVALIEPHAPRARTGRPPFAIETMLRVHCLQQWFSLSDAAMQEALHDVPLYREFAGLDGAVVRLPDETTILRFRHLLEAHDLAAKMLGVVNDILGSKGLMLRTGTAVDATLIAAPSSTKNKEGTRDPEMHQTKKGNQWHFGMKAHIGVDADSGLVHTVVGTPANVNDVTQGHALLHGQEEVVFADAGYQGVMKREGATGVQWQVAMRPGKRKALDKSNPIDALTENIERLKASIRSKVEHPFRVIKRQFGFVKVRYRGLAKNTAQVKTLFALSNLWMARKRMVQGAWAYECVCSEGQGPRRARNGRLELSLDAKNAMSAFVISYRSQFASEQRFGSRCAEHPQEAAFFVDRGKVTNGRVHAHAVVEALDPVDDVQAGLGPSVVAYLVGPIDLQCLEEALHRGVVPAFATPSHAAGDFLSSSKNSHPS